MTLKPKQVSYGLSWTHFKLHVSSSSGFMTKLINNVKKIELKRNLIQFTSTRLNKYERSYVSCFTALGNSRKKSSYVSRQRFVLLGFWKSLSFEEIKEWLKKRMSGERKGKEPEKKKKSSSTSSLLYSHDSLTSHTLVCGLTTSHSQRIFSALAGEFRCLRLLYGSNRWQTFVVILGMMIENVRRITCEYVLPSIMWWKFPFTAFIRNKEKQNEATEKKSKQRRLTGKR